MRAIAIAALGVCAACKGSTSGGGGLGTGSGPSPVVVTDAAAGPDSGRASGPTLASLAAVAENPDAIAALVATDPATLAWDLFLYLDWPATPGVRGVPDPSRGLGATPVVWQTWKEVHETYTSPAAPRHRRGRTAARAGPRPRRSPRLMAPRSRGRERTETHFTYTVLLNQGTFEYLVSRTLYAYTGQAALRAPGAAPVQFPTSAMEVKASWKILDPIADKDCLDYYVVGQLLLPQDGGGGAPTKVTVGLTGLHITSKALPNWIWITFEQIENPITTGVKPLVPIDPAVATVNAQMQAALAGTPLAYYQLMGVQTEYTASGQPTLLANTQIDDLPEVVVVHHLPPARVDLDRQGRAPRFVLDEGGQPRRLRRRARPGAVRPGLEPVHRARLRVVDARGQAAGPPVIREPSMSALDRPRLHFLGQMAAITPTANNNNYDLVVEPQAVSLYPASRRTAATTSSARR